MRHVAPLAVSGKVNLENASILECTPVTGYDVVNLAFKEVIPFDTYTSSSFVAILHSRTDAKKTPVGQS